MHTSFVDFLNHGTLPFVGRQTEQKRIIRFWRSTDADRSELRIALLVGEAGSGKSRLIEETLPMIEEQDGVVVHAKLRPEGSASLAPLIAMGISRSDSARRLSLRIPGENLPAVIGALRRLCSLRRTLLVIEDIHLLAGETLREFVLLVEALADEPLAMLVAARPLELAARGIVQSYLSEEIVLEKLSEEAIGQMWKEIFSIDAPEEAVGKLMQATQGNALAIRSALRGSVHAGSIVQQRQGSDWQVQIDVGAFGEIARQSTHGIVDGMVADLQAEQLDAAWHLALLGEAFSQEAAEIMIEGAEGTIETLIFKGILAHSTTAVTPLSSIRSSRLPLVFTHTLLHNALSERRQAIPERLLSVLASDVPIYSLLPLRLLRQLPSSSTLSHEELEKAIVQMSVIAAIIDTTTHWGEAIEIFRTGEHLATLLAPLVPPPRRQEVQAELAGQKLYLLRRNIASPEYKALADDFYRQTAERTGDKLRQLHLDAVTHLFRYSVTCNGTYDKGQLDQAFEMAEGDRTLRTSRHFLNLLTTLGTFALNHPDAERAMLERVERAMEELLSDTESSEVFRDYVFRLLARYFLGTFNTPEQLEKRKEMAARLEKMSSPDDLSVHTYHVRFLMTVGWFDQLLERLPSLIQQLRDRGLGTYLTLHDFEIVALGLIGQDLSALLAHVRQLLAEAESQRKLSEHGYRIKGFYLHLVALLRGDLNYTQIIYSEFLRRDENLHHYNLILQRLWEERIDDLKVLAEALPPEDEELRVCMKICLGDSIPDGDFQERYGDFDKLPVVNVYSFIIIYIHLSLLDHALQQGYIPASTELSQRIASVLDACLEWFAERKLYACMSPLLDRHGSHLPAKELSRWRARTEAIDRERKQKAQAEGSDRLRISMIGTITVQHPGAEAQRLRGGRNQAALGLLVANAMLRKPLDRVTFFALATGITDDPERARTTWNVVALRLRETIGRDALRTEEEVPQLNRDAVHVNLLEAWDRLARAEQSLRRGRLVDARESCLAVIESAAGKVIFPTLYDELFETLRDDFENRLRGAVLNVARALIEASDTVGAEELLGCYSAAVPDDEEVGEMMVKVIEGSGWKSGLRADVA